MVWYCHHRPELWGSRTSHEKPGDPPHTLARSGFISSVQWAYPFNEPVDTKRYDNYLTYVKRPIDFGTIKRKLEAGGYKVPDDMHADIQQAGLDLICMDPAMFNFDSDPSSCLCICERLGLSWYSLMGHANAPLEELASAVCSHGWHHMSCCFLCRCLPMPSCSTRVSPMWA